MIPHPEWQQTWIDLLIDWATAALVVVVTLAALQVIL
jgi:hypothetical protein